MFAMEIKWSWKTIRSKTCAFFQLFQAKDLWIYGQNTQIAKYMVGGEGRLKNSYSFTDTQYFLDFSMHIKAECMSLFDIFYVFVENSVNSELCFFGALLKPAKI